MKWIMQWTTISRWIYKYRIILKGNPLNSNNSFTIKRNRNNWRGRYILGKGVSILTKSADLWAKNRFRSYNHHLWKKHDEGPPPSCFSVWVLNWIVDLQTHLNPVTNKEQEDKIKGRPGGGSILGNRVSEMVKMVHFPSKIQVPNL